MPSYASLSMIASAIWSQSWSSTARYPPAVPGPRNLAEDVGVLWRPPLGDVAPVSATLDGGGRAELIYLDRREIRAWPSFELLDTMPAGEAGPAGSAPVEGVLTAQLTRAIGGSVCAVSAGPSARMAALWTAERFPPWYRVVIWDQSGHVMTPDTVRIAGSQRWSPSGELAAGAFDGIRRGVVLIDPHDGSARWWSRPAAASYQLLALGPGADDALAVQSGDDGSARLVRAGPAVPTNYCDRCPAPTMSSRPPPLGIVFTGP
jgi:hypothetical protein